MAMPVCLIGAMVKGKANFCTVAWFTMMDDEPPMIAFVLGKDRATKDGIEENGTFSVNIPSELNVADADYCGINSGHEVDKSKVFSVSFGTLRNRTSGRTNARSVRNADCRRSIEFPGTDMVIGEVVQVHVDEVAGQ